MSTKKKKNTKLKKDYNKEYIFSFNQVVMMALFLIILIPALLGVHFDKEFLITHIITAICILIVLVLGKDKKINLLKNEIDYLLLAFTLIYIFSIFWAVFRQGAIEEALKYINYFSVFWFISRFVEKKQTINVCKILYFIGVFIAILGLLAYFHLINVDSFVSGGRITATLKYTNALASYVSAMFVLGMYFYLNDSKKWLYLFCNFLLFLTFIGTFSRAAWLIFPVVFLVFLVGYPEKKKRILFISSLTIIIISILTSTFLFTDGTHDEKIEENKIMERIDKIDLKESSAQLRFTFYQDALKIIKKHLILGAGGAGWEALYPLNRTFLYYSREVHSFLLETGVEVGLLGVFIIIGIVFLALSKMFTKRNPLNWTFGASLGMIFAHSLVDLDLSLGFMGIVTWALLGLFVINIDLGFFKNVNIHKSILISIISIYLLICLSVLTSNHLGQVVNSENKYKTISEKLKRATILNPFNPSNYANLARVNFIAYKYTSDINYYHKTIENINKAIAVDKTNYNWYLSKAQYQLENGKLLETIETLQQGKPYLFKFTNETYAETVKVLTKVAEQQIKQKKFNDSQNTFHKIIELWNEANQDIDSVPPHLKKFWQQPEVLTEYDEFVLEVIRAYNYLEQKDLAQKLIKKLDEETIRNNRWLQDL